MCTRVGVAVYARSNLNRRRRALARVPPLLTRAGARRRPRAGTPCLPRVPERPGALTSQLCKRRERAGRHVCCASYAICDHVYVYASTGMRRQEASRGESQRVFFGRSCPSRGELFSRVYNFRSGVVTPLPGAAGGAAVAARALSATPLRWPQSIIGAIAEPEQWRRRGPRHAGGACVRRPRATRAPPLLPPCPRTPHTRANRNRAAHFIAQNRTRSRNTTIDRARVAAKMFFEFFPPRGKAACVRASNCAPTPCAY